MLEQTAEVPSELKPVVEAALAWVNADQQRQFELSGLVDVEQTQQKRSQNQYELGLVLCDGEICTREQILVQPQSTGFEFSYAQLAQREIPSLLDPPLGIRKNWLEEQIASHEFVLLLFYRGLW